MAENNGTLTFKVSYEQKPEQEISLGGFLFNCYGILIAKQLVHDGVLEFSLANSTRENTPNVTVDTKQLRLFIAPVDDKNIESINTIEQLENYKPYEPVLTRDAKGSFNILPIPSQISQFWPFCFCRVTGKVSKWFHVGNIWEDRAVCKARVHICEIDAIWYWIYRIPDYIIAKIPEAILNPQEVIKFHVPVPDPPPFMQREVQPLKTKSLFKTSSVEEKQVEITSKLPELGTDIRQNLASGNLNLIRETIAKNYALLHPWFCLWPWWWPWFYRCTELAVVYTDASGRFDTNVLYQCFGDKPDIYIWVEYFINGAWTTVYNPPIPCNTLWNYTCGTNINIQITDDRVPGDCCCNCDLPGELVWVRSVGSRASVSHIYQKYDLNLPPLPQTVAYNRVGLTDASAIYDEFFVTTPDDYKRPFGGSPSFYMGFGSDLPNTGIYYYRWNYKQVANAALVAVSDSYKPLQQIGGTLYKYYEYEYTDSHGELQIGTDSVTLGPITIGGNDNLYIIPPVNPNMAPFNVLSAHPERSNPEWVERTYNMNTISFDSSALKRGTAAGNDGLYEFELQLFDEAGSLLSAIPKSTFKTPEHNNGGFSEDAPDIYLENVTASTADAFNMLLRIDNSKCNADIFTVNVNGTPASSDCCGFVKYKHHGVEADLDLSFLATQPNNFAVFEFNVERGTCYNDEPTIADAEGMVIDSASGYTLSGGIYDKHFTPAQLLGTCYKNGEGKAAFAETLAVIATATDGTYRLIANDAGRVAAFALEP